ncbi:hypothetical protein LEP1GSC151_5175 [Leptospira interrogans serovar Grippotyphosa str. LT2186]|uniref:DUF4878 domain-containing protein n=4 Tax=Leptospira interrogans TaxID=173 RepID=M3HY74_LEPIR|nr:hypothetical protein LEP1GSC067_2459 [Leptospira interrogans serovar Lora str. TE 1992]EMG08607.1 hypothetical protein LEP1GSC151_5175 [Leptospira interrogans serovar Grippotyphosa str. LT2186]EMY06920.1 hypothetical protein LEP1GSC029_0387 [Leptospira interrogans str. 2002000626]EMY22695.1 hypothetical protein LEP1GSC115_4605 [Leptospira interrogans serovar Australis str. 200703203]
MLGVFFINTKIIKSQSDTSISTFWKEFKDAVLKNDSEKLASLSRFPIKMPYGYTQIKNKKEFLKRYDEIFSRQADAKECFQKEKQPVADSERTKEYIVSCKMRNGAPDEEPVVYGFTYTKTGWKLIYLDNINE